MKIVVCAKQVLESEQLLKIGGNLTRITANDSAGYRMNRFDEFAVEEAIRIKESIPNVTVDIITVGPERALAVIQRGIGMGVNCGIHIRTQEDGYLSPFVTASWIVSAIGNHGYNMILTGVMSEDDMHGQVGPIVAEYFGWSCATSVIFQEPYPEKQCVYIEREIEGGYRDRMEIGLPAVLTIQSGINKPRYPSLSNLLRAKRMQIKTIDSGSLAHADPRQKLAGLSYPEKMRSGIFLKGTQQEKAEKLLRVFREKSFM